MANNGKYVRPLGFCDASRTDASGEEHEQIINCSNIDQNSNSEYSESDSNASDCPENSSGCGSNEDSEDDDSVGNRQNEQCTGNIQSQENESPSSPNGQERVAINHESLSSRHSSLEKENSERMKQIEKVLTDLTKAISHFQSNTPQPMHREAEQTWDFSRESTKIQPTSSNVRTEHIKPFPSGVRPNKMWAEWFDFIENFEVAVSLHNANDPVYRSKLLYLSLGQELQAIVKASNLRPSLADTNCYTAFVSNIENHLRSMTDTAAEHQAFLRMKQEKGESTVAFHARLVRNVKLCGYSVSDQTRFVRAQLLDGLKNKEIVKAARTYGYDTSFIVQSSTRDEAYEAEITEQLTDPNVFEIGQGYRSSMKRSNTQQWSGPSTIKQRRINSDFTQRQEEYSNPPRRGNSFSHGMRDNRLSTQTHGRRTRCPRCNNAFHRNPQCPALSRRCDSCGQRGHFAATCRAGRLRTVQQDVKYSDAESSSEEVPSGSKQVKQD